MGLLIQSDDFTGKWDLAKSNEDKIDDYIEEYEEMYLTELLGKDLFDLFAADVNLTTREPATPIYQKIFEPFTVDINGYIYSSEGLKKMLLGFIYFQYVRDNRVKQTMNGAIDQQTEVGTASDYTFLYPRYNKAVQTYSAIQAYIYDNLTDYLTFAGVNKKKTSFI
jgi:hypothetical protein